MDYNHLKNLHIISFNNPWPPDYGGVIDVFYKIKALSEKGIKIYLHVFQYNRPGSTFLESLCEKVFYYPRKTGLISQISIYPYIVRSRRSGELIPNLLRYPGAILFEGLHSCYCLDHPALQDRVKLVRTHNIEHEYYAFLCKATGNLFQKLYFGIESLRLRIFEKHLRSASIILAISPADTDYFMKRYGKTRFIGAFHANQSLTVQEGRGAYILFHGNLSVPENETAVIHCIRNIFNKLDFPVVIAGKSPSPVLKKELYRHKIILAEDPSEQEMEKLQRDAHIHVCYSFQSAGLKLKLLNSLYKGRFVICNNKVTSGTGLEGLTLNGESDEQIIALIRDAWPKSLNSEEISKRKEGLIAYDPGINAEKIISLIP